MKTLPEEIRLLLERHPGWSLVGNELVRAWTFPTFPEAIAFVNRVAAIAEEADHHPDIDVRYNRVRLALTSHDTKALTPRDARMAARLDDEFPL